MYSHSKREQKSGKKRVNVTMRRTQKATPKEQLEAQSARLNGVKCLAPLDKWLDTIIMGTFNLPKSFAMQTTFDGVW